MAIIKDQSSENATQIRDLGLAAALVAVGCVMAGTKRDGRGRVYFLFENNEDTSLAIKTWQTNELDVRARSYFEAIKTLKDIIYSERY